MKEWQVEGEAIVSYTTIVEAETEEEAWDLAKDEGCPWLGCINEVESAEPKKVSLLQQ